MPVDEFEYDDEGHWTMWLGFALTFVAIISIVVGVVIYAN